MAATNWLKQTPDKPLYPDLLWSQPENKNLAGKLLVIGGNAHGFAAPAEAYAEAGKAGIGTARVLLPDSLQKTVGQVFEAGEYVPSTPSGSFSRQALAELLALSQWADGVLLAGDFGRNSETAILLESFIDKYTGQLTLTQDTVDYFVKSPDKLLGRTNTLLVLSFEQMQKLASAAGFTKAFTFDMDFLRLVDELHELTVEHGANIMLKHHKNFFVAASGRVSATQRPGDLKAWRIATASHGAVWWLQNPGKTFEALTTSLV